MLNEFFKPQESENDYHYLYTSVSNLYQHYCYFLQTMQKLWTENKAQH